MRKKTTRGASAQVPFAVSGWLLLAALGLLGCAAEDPAPGGETRQAMNDEHPDDEHPDDEHSDGNHSGDEHGGEHHDEEGSDVVELAPEAEERIGLRTATVTRRALHGQRATTGRLGFDEDRLAHVAPRVSGRLVRVPASLGERVRAGETLAVLDSLELGEARAGFLRARAREEAARRRYERERSLREERISTEQDLLDAEAAAREAAADLALARESLRLLGLEDPEIDALSWEAPDAALVEVRAPFGGRVVEREATVGELVGPEDTLFTVADLSEVWLWLDLYERDLAHLAPGAAVEARFDAWPDEVVRGELSYLGDELDPESRTLRARAVLPNPQRRLKPGMFARVSFSTGEAAASPPVLAGEASPVRAGGSPPVLAVPREALQRDGEQTVAFVRTAPGRYERRDVLVGRIAGDFAEVVAGLEEGDEVVTTGAFLLRSQTAADELGGHHH